MAARDAIRGTFDSRENLFGNVRQMAFGIKSVMCGACKQKYIEVLRNVWQT